MRVPVLGLALLSFASACESSSVLVPRSEVEPPLLPDWNDEGSVWEHVASRYDADGDGAVAREEYTRDDVAFARLDRDRDGTLTEADFPDESEQMEALRARLANAVVERYLQDDDDLEALTLDELFVAAEVFDLDGDELLTEEEFRTVGPDRKREIPMTDEVRMMGNYDPWTALVDAIDEDGDGALGFAELGAYFEAHDLDADLVWLIEPAEASAPGLEPSSGPRVGTLAPDFELLPPDGGDPVRLSSFRGDRPVALVFGSAT
jgi:Ca2+-binding EF-hand superfamily protein